MFLKNSNYREIIFWEFLWLTFSYLFSVLYIASNITNDTVEWK